MPFETEYATQLRDQGYRTGWKDGYNAGYNAAWKEVKELEAAEKDEDLTEVSEEEDQRVRAVLEAAKKESPVEISVLREGDWTEIPVSEVVKKASESFPSY